MKVLVVGRGGREHSIVMKLAESERVTKIFAAPGNGGMESMATCVPIDEMNIGGLVQFAKEEKIDLTVVGPEDPLNAGIADRFQEEGLKVFAPLQNAALLEGSKSFAKEFMQKYDIPTAAYDTFTDAEEAKAYIEKQGAPIVIKADGLAAGKGVVVAETVEQAKQAVDDMLIEKAFKEAGAKVVIEECLVGKEYSLMAFVHEDGVYPMIPARDHKRAYDNDEGPNTGGMGSFAPVPDVTQEDIDYSVEKILKPAANGLIKEGRPFTGILYAGLMMTESGPKVIEFNTRFGDPETQIVLPLLENDLLQVMLDVMEGNDPKLVWEDSHCVGVVLASKGYPRGYEKGTVIPEFNVLKDTFVVHAGTKKIGDKVVSDGGRVLLVGAKADTLEAAATRTYEVFPNQENEAFFYRKDIAKSTD
jgi:phosphoribosylamine--glycine ligase